MRLNSQRARGFNVRGEVIEEHRLRRPRIQSSERLEKDRRLGLHHSQLVRQKNLVKLLQNRQLGLEVFRMQCIGVRQRSELYPSHQPVHLGDHFLVEPEVTVPKFHELTRANLKPKCPAEFSTNTIRIEVASMNGVPEISGHESFDRFGR